MAGERKGVGREGERVEGRGREEEEGKRRALLRAVRDAGINHTSHNTTQHIAPHNSTALSPPYLGGGRVDRRVVSDDIFSKQPINTYK